jgi:hypothetical protein
MHGGQSKPASEVFIVQVATIGGPKLGLPEDPAGAWIDHEVYFDREEAEQRARLHETSQQVDLSGRDITSEVVTALVSSPAKSSNRNSELTASDSSSSGSASA